MTPCAPPSDRWAGPLCTEANFEGFYVMFRLRALAWVHRREPCWDDATCEDVTAEAWAAVYDHVGYIDHARAYLYRTLNAKISDERKRRRARPQARDDDGPEASDPRADPEGVAMLPAVLEEIRAELQEVHQAVQELPEKPRDAYILRVGGEPMSSAEIAEALGCSVNVVDSRVSRARTQLRSRFGADRLAQFETVAGRTA